MMNLANLSDIASKPRGRRRSASIPRVTTTVLSARGLETAIDHMLSLLGDVHTAISVFHIAWPRGARTLKEAAVMEAVVADALAPLGNVGRSPRGGAHLVYLGPRGSDAPPDHDALTGFILNRLEGRMADHGLGHLTKDIRVRAVHGWTDGVRGARALLERVPTR